ncbi:MAG TPA: hypothetical protein VFN82_04465, partial [Solirubrobacterales bacterium]|nr:hypothetical protein [Solirubrobacterales bacterium]
MALKLIHGPPNSGRRGEILRAFRAALERGPILVVPTADDVFDFERELSTTGAVLGGAVMSFGGLFATAATLAGAPPGRLLSDPQRLRAISLAIASRRPRLGPLRRSADRPRFATALKRLLDELQAAGIEPEAVEASAGTLEGSAYLGDLAALYSGYEETRKKTGRADSHAVAREAIRRLREDGSAWDGRPVLFYGFDDLTESQLELVSVLSQLGEVTFALTYEAGSAALEARAKLLGRLRGLGAAEETVTAADPDNTPSRLLFHLERSFGVPRPPRLAPDGSLTLLRSAGTRAEAEAVAAHVARLLHRGAEAGEIAIVLRDPARRGPELAAALDANGVAPALEAELPVSGSGVGGALVALLEAEFGTGRAADLLRYLRGPSGVPSQRVDWFERRLRRRRVRDARTALVLWQGEDREIPRDLARLRDAAGRSRAELVAEVAGLAGRMASRPLRGGGDGPMPPPGEGVELRAAAAISAALGELGELGDLAPGPDELAATIEELRFRVWSGPVAGRVRIADPYRLRAARFDHVVLASLQDGEFPRRDRATDPFLADSQRLRLGLDPRRDSETEERYLFHACLALPRLTLALSYRDSDEDGTATVRSPLIDDVRALLAPPPTGPGPDPLEAELTLARDLAQVVPPLGEAASEDELARALAAHGPAADAPALLAKVGVEGELAWRLVERLDG